MIQNFNYSQKTNNNGKSTEKSMFISRRLKASAKQLAQWKYERVTQ